MVSSKNMTVSVPDSIRRLAEEFVESIEGFGLDTKCLEIRLKLGEQSVILDYDTPVPDEELLQEVQ